MPESADLLDLAAKSGSDQGGAQQAAHDFTRDFRRQGSLGFSPTGQSGVSREADQRSFEMDGIESVYGGGPAIISGAVQRRRGTGRAAGLLARTGQTDRNRIDRRNLHGSDGCSSRDRSAATSASLAR